MSRTLGLFAAALAAVAVLGALAGLANRWLDESRDVELSVTGDEMPPAPIAGTADASAVWTGDEFIVFGGGRGGKVDNELSADGVALDPDTRSWRTIAPSPLGPRERHVGVWTGREMLIWGGTARHHGVGDLVDGALYDPASDTWRTITRAPIGTDRSSAQAIVAGRRVVIAGGRTPEQEAERQILVYDLDADAWRVVEAPFFVSQVLARSDGRVALLGLGRDQDGHRDAQTLVVAHLSLDGVDGPELTGPRRTVEVATGHVAHGGLVESSDGGLHLLFGGMQDGRGSSAATRVVRISDDGSTTTEGQVGRSDDRLYGPVDWFGMGTASPVGSLGDRILVTTSGPEPLWVLDLEHRIAGRVPGGHLPGCPINGEAVALAGARVFSWSESGTCLVDVAWPQG